MGRIIVTEFVSLDGVMEDPGGSEEFKHGGWAFEFSRGDEGDRFKLDETMASDALLLGRVTYDGFAPVWPQVEGEFGDKFNSMPKYVVSTTLETADWDNTTILDAEPFARIREIKASQNVLTWGSAQLVQGMLAEGLVDELVLLYSPIVLGEGKRLFGEGARHDLEVTETTRLGGGMLALRLAAAR